MKKDENERSNSESRLLGIKPVVDQFHGQKRSRGTKYPSEVRKAVVEGWDSGKTISKISELLGINISTISAWRRFLPNQASGRPRAKVLKGNLKELQIVPDPNPRDVVTLGEIIEVHLPNQVVLEIPSQRVGLDLLKGLMALGAVCS